MAKKTKGGDSNRFLQQKINLKPHPKKPHSAHRVEKSRSDFWAKQAKKARPHQDHPNQELNLQVHVLRPGNL